MFPEIDQWLRIDLCVCEALSLKKVVEDLFIQREKERGVISMARQSTKPTLEMLQAELADSNYKVRQEAIRKLMRYQRQAALEPLLGCLEDGRSNVRVKAVQALGRLADKRALVPLVGLLDDKSLSVRVKVVGILGIFGDSSVVHPLQTLLNDPRPQIRMAAAKSLGQLRDPGSLPLLLAYLKQASANEIYYLTRAIGDFDTPGVIEPLLAICAKDPTVQGIISDSLSRLGASSTPLLLNILVDWTRPTIMRSCVAMSLGKTARPGSLQPLLKALNDPEEEVRRYAAWALGTLQDQRAIQPLTALLSDVNGSVCQEAIRALSVLGAIGVEDQLIACLASHNANVVQTAALMLRRSHVTRAVPALFEAYLRLSEAYISPLIDTLCELAGPAVIDMLLQRWPEISHELSWRYIAVFGRFLDQRSVEPLLSLLSSQPCCGYEYHLQVQLVRLLARLGDARAIEPLYAMRKQATFEHVVLEALRALEAANPQRV